MLSLRLPARARIATLVTAAALLALPAGLLTGCDNPACVFGGDCSQAGQGGALGTLSASAPESGQLLRAAVPFIQRFAPTGNAVDPRTAIAIVFSEAMSNATLGFAYELDQVGFGAVPLGATALVGDGRVLVLFPITALTLGAQYRVSYRDTATVGDRTGQAIMRPSDGVVGLFTVASVAPLAPSVILSYPSDMETGLPTTTELTVVFSRPMDATTVNNASFVVETGGMPPEFDDAASPVVLSGVVQDTRCFRWRSVDAEGERASLGTDREVTLDLSPTGAKIEDVDGVELAASSRSFRTLPFSAPTSAAITSMPTDAIGIANVTGAADLAVRVDMLDAIAGDELGVFVFGVQPEDVEAPLTIALFRAVTVVAPPTSFTFTAAELDLLRTASPLAGRVRDGTLQMAFRVKRGDLESSVTTLDVDSIASGTQGPVLDTTAPTLMGVGNAGTSTGAIVSDARDVVITGRASESLRAALVTTMLGDNELVPGEIPPVVGSDPTTMLFVAAPVRTGVLQSIEQPLGYQLTIYDRALNASGVASGTYEQRGAASSGAARPFANVDVEVFDANTLLPLQGVELLTHEDVGGSLFLVDSATTDVDGRAVLDPALVGRTLVTARRTGYDLFTFDGLPTDAVSIPLAPSATSTATVAGIIASVDPSIVGFTRRVADTRFPRPGETLATVSSCTFDGIDQRFECNFGPVPVKARELGAIASLATMPPTSLAFWSAPTFLRGYGLRLPLGEQSGGAAQSTIVALERLDTTGIDEELQAVDVPPHVLMTTFWPILSGEPRIRVEGLVPGMRGPLTVGQGLAFGTGLPPQTFAVRAAYPGIADPISDGRGDEVGQLVLDGVIGAEIYLRAEVVDPDGARGIDRPRLSLTDLTLAPPDAPGFVGSVLVLNVTGEAYDASFSDVLPDATGQPGIHRLTLTDSAGRRWTVWRLDEPDAMGPEVVVHLPLAQMGAAFPLAAGTLAAVASSWSWTDFDSASFSWTDVEREFERAAHSAPTVLGVP